MSEPQPPTARLSEPPTADGSNSPTAGMESAAAAPGDPPAWVPPVIPGYQVLAELGRGGMGVVYKARQVGLDRVVALKMVLHAEHASAEARRRFQAEAQAIARLQHPNIVQLHEVAEHNRIP